MTPECSVCRKPIPADEGPHDLREVVFGNGLIARACLACWLRWPNEHKLFPAFGYGRVRDAA